MKKKKYAKVGPIKMKNGGNLKDLSIDEIMGPISTISGIVGQAVDSIRDEYNLEEAVMQKTNPYMRSGGNVEGAKEFNAPSHEQGGQGITTDGKVSAKPDVEIEGTEIFFKFNRTPDRDKYVFSDANGTSGMAKQVLDKHAVKSNKSKKPDHRTDMVKRQMLELEMSKIAKLNDTINKAKEAAAQMDSSTPQMGYGGKVKKMAGGGDPFKEGLESVMGQADIESNLAWLDSQYDDAAPWKTLEGLVDPKATPNLIDSTLSPVPEWRKDIPVNESNASTEKKANSKGAFARGSGLFLDALQTMLPVEQEPLITPDYSEADRAMDMMSVNLDAARDEAAGAYNAGKQAVRESSTSLQGLMARQTALAGQLSKALADIAGQERQIGNQIAGTKGQYEAGKASQIAAARMEQRVNQLQNEAQKYAIKERMIDNLYQVGFMLDQKDVAELTNKEGLALLKSYGDNVGVDQNADGTFRVRFNFDRQKG